MTTVVDPIGTPVPVYTRSGTTIAEYSGGSNLTPTLLDVVAGHSVFLLETNGGANNFEMPSGTEIGDVIEVYKVLGDGTSINIIPAAGESMDGGAVASAAFFRKIDATTWRMIGQ